MTWHPLPRDAAGRIVLPGRVHTFDVDFRATSTLPSWLTATAGGGSAGITSNELQIASGTNASTPAYVAGPSFNWAQLEAIAFTCYDLRLTAGSGSSQVMQGISTAASITGNASLGAMIHVPSGSTSAYLRATDGGDWPPADDFLVDTAHSRSAARVTRTIVVLPRTGMVYALEDETEVMHARDLSGRMTNGAVQAILMARYGNAAGTVACSRIRIEAGYL